MRWLLRSAATRRTAAMLDAADSWAQTATLAALAATRRVRTHSRRRSSCACLLVWRCASSRAAGTGVTTTSLLCGRACRARCLRALRRVRRRRRRPASLLALRRAGPRAACRVRLRRPCLAAAQPQRRRYLRVRRRVSRRATRRPRGRRGRCSTAVTETSRRRV